MTTNNRNARQVVIAGAGPVGCVTALILARANVSVTILEAGEDLVPELRASTFYNSICWTSSVSRLNF